MFHAEVTTRAKTVNFGVEISTDGVKARKEEKWQWEHQTFML